MTDLNSIPSGAFKNLKSDLIAAFSVALIALPLSLGIALAAGAPAMSGIFSAVVGGVVTTLYRGGHISVNGPAKGVIGVILLGLTIMDDGSGQAFNYVLAAIVVSGILQMLLGVLKLGRLAEVFHSSVIHGILAAIGIIIFAKQIHVAMGTHSESKSIVQNLIDAVVLIPEANPFVLAISLVGLLLLLFQSKISYRFFHWLPAPIWVIGLSIPFAYFFNFFEDHTTQLLGKNYQLGPELLLSIPNSITDSIMLPNFGQIGTIEFWLTTFSILIITSIESLAIAKAVDKIDPYKRKTDLNKDLTGIGFSTMIGGMIGALPIIAVIIRSTVNIHNGAKTKWSNMYQGLLLLLFIVVLSPILKQVPLCAFAILLVFTGYKLASPSVFKQAYDKGAEQLIFFTITMIITIYTNLLVGLIGGLLLALVTHMLLARMSITDFFRNVYNSRTKLLKLESGDYILKIRGIANFLGILKIGKTIAQIPTGASVNIDLSETRLVGMTYMEYLAEFIKTQRASGGDVRITGLDSHVSTSTYNKAMKMNLSGSLDKLSPRQKRLRNLATEKNYHFTTHINWNTAELKKFHFFEIRPIERKYNCLSGSFNQSKVSWEITDVTFNEGQAFTAETFNTTLMFLRLKKEIPVFTIEKEAILEHLIDRVMAMTGHKDVDFDMYPNFSEKFLITGPDEQKIKTFFTPEIIRFFEEHQIYHLESKGDALIIFDKIKLARTDETISLLKFGNELSNLLNQSV